MVGPTRSSPNGFGATGSSDLPPPPPMTPSEAFMATQTEVLRQFLQTQADRSAGELRAAAWDQSRGA
jgi:hypothetical protein